MTRSFPLSPATSYDLWSPNRCTFPPAWFMLVDDRRPILRRSKLVESTRCLRWDSLIVRSCRELFRDTRFSFDVPDVCSNIVEIDFNESLVATVRGNVCRAWVIYLDYGYLCIYKKFQRKDQLCLQVITTRTFSTNPEESHSERSMQFQLSRIDNW